MSFTIESLIMVFKLYFTYKMMTWNGILLGLFLSFCLFFLYRFIIEKIYDITFSSIDQSLIGFTEDEKYNILVVLVIDDFNPEKLKELIIERGFKTLKKLRSKLIYKFYNYWWKEVSVEEASKRIIISKTTIREEELNKYAEIEINKHLDIFNEIPCEFHLYKFENSSKGVLFVKMDHVISDGLGIFSFISCLADNYSPQLFPEFMRQKHYKFYQRITDIIQFPYYGIVNVLRVATAPEWPTLFRKPNVKATGTSKCSYSINYDMKDIEKKRKNMNMTFNNFIVSLVSYSINKLYKKMGIEDECPKWLNFVIPSGRTGIPKSIKDIELYNQSQGFLIQLPIIKDFDKESAFLSKTLTSNLRKQGLAAASQLTVRLLLEYLPLKLHNIFNLMAMKKIDMIVSNVPGPSTHLFYGGSKVLEIIPILNSGRLKTFVPVFCYCKKFRLVVAYDTSLKREPTELVQCIQDSMEEILKID
jgi:hypothetical protein